MTAELRAKSPEGGVAQSAQAGVAKKGARGRQRADIGAVSRVTGRVLTRTHAMPSVGRIVRVTLLQSIIDDFVRPCWRARQFLTDIEHVRILSGESVGCEVCHFMSIRPGFLIFGERNFRLKNEKFQRSPAPRSVHVVRLVRNSVNFFRKVFSASENAWQQSVARSGLD